MTPGPVPVVSLKYSDYLSGAAILFGFLAGYSWIVSAHPEWSGPFGAAAGAAAALSQWLQSKGD